MKYQDLYRIRFTGQLSISDLFEKVRHSPTDWVLIADMSYQCLENVDIDTSNHKTIYVPQILPFSSKIQNPFGKKINHVALQANLKTQPILTNVGVRPDFVPFAVMAHKATLMRLVRMCFNTEDLFLQLSLLLNPASHDVKVLEGWLATVKFRESKPEARAVLVSTYTRRSLEYFLSTEKDEIVVKQSRGSINGTKNSNRDGFIRLFEKVHGNDVLLTDSYSNDYQFCQYNYLTFALNPDIDADFYFALPGAMISEFDMARTFAQIVLPDHTSPGPLFTPDLNPVGTFAIKQFSSSINFAPPFTTCSNNLLTAIEILISCSPKSILINSNSVLSALVAAGDNAESIKRQTFMTRIIEHCTDRGISLKILGDVCQLN